MSIAVAIKAPEGLVLAAESRLTIQQIQTQDLNPVSILINYDNATKLMAFPNEIPDGEGLSGFKIGVLTYGQAMIGGRTPQSFIPEFEIFLRTELKNNNRKIGGRIPINVFAEHLKNFFNEQWRQWIESQTQPPDNITPMTFIVCGFDKNEPYGKVFLINVPGNSPIDERNQGASFGMTMGGQFQLILRLLSGVDQGVQKIVQEIFKPDDAQMALFNERLETLKLPTPLQVMPLQDCVDLAIFMIRTTIDIQQLSLGIRGTGGHIDVATITRREGLRFIQQKQIKGER